MVSKSSPVQVVGGHSFVGISSGSLEHSLARKSNGEVWSWGDNFYGQLGDNTTVSKSSPVQVSGIINCVQIRAGVTMSLALVND